MAVDMFLEIEGEIKGESKDQKHADEIDILAWSWGLSNSGTMHMGSGNGGGKVNFQDISVTKYIDSASHALMLYCANGDHFESAKIYVRKAGKIPLEYLVITMTKVLVTSYSTGGSGGDDPLTENISFNFETVKVEYKKQKADGSGEAAKTFAWNISENKAS